MTGLALPSPLAGAARFSLPPSMSFPLMVRAIRLALEGV